MIKCFYTGIQLKEDEAYVLDIGEARRIFRELKDRTNAIEKLIKELGEVDEVEINSRTGKKIRQRRRRLICKQIASAFIDTYRDAVVEKCCSFLFY
ncbi:MAG: hypothetical protein M1480_19520 [Bacteroidetes bacterium]|nr:hypothetical protein [Bacteroidota bacterium]